MDFYNNSIMLYILEKNLITAQHVSPEDVAASLLSVAQLFTGMLPPNTLWYTRKELHAETAIYVSPGKHRVAVVTKPLEPPERFMIPMPGLVFICSSGQPPKVFAVKERPETMECPVYGAPLFNVYSDGRTCNGTHQYNENVSKIPEEFFTCFFSLTTFNKFSKSHPDSLYNLWKELEGKDKYPLDDLVQAGKIKDII
ncbi:MAG: hypothetical protein PHN44_00490 [Candidatus Marinimicrobia bacterium]|nr:hypothetical protein [Candidatus Neomarinimicrobiota bacterium]